MFSKIVLIYIIFGFCDYSLSFRIIDLTESNLPSLPLSSIGSLSSNDLVKSISPLKEKSNEKSKSVIILEGGKAVPFTDNDSALSTSEFEKNSDSDKVEEGVGVPLSVDYGQALPLDEKFSENKRNLDGSGDKVEFSGLRPVYVKPPTDFKPIIFANRQLDGIPSILNLKETLPTLSSPARPYPYRYPNGLSSWILGGLRGHERTGFWESLASDQSLNGYKTDRLPIQINSWQNKPYQTDKSSYEVISPLRSLLFPSTRTKPSLNTRNPFDFESWLYREKNPTSLPKSPSLVIENIEFIPFTKDQTISSTRLTPNYEFKSNLLKDLMTSDGGTSDPIFVESEDVQKSPRDLNNVFTATVILRSEPNRMNIVDVEK